ncbi:MAG: HD-GYP domain-containing protein [Bauldia sp.]
MPPATTLKIISPTPAADEEALRLSELLSALSHALDLTEGQPEGHCVRCCWIGTAIGRELGLAETELWELYYTLLLKDVGCSSNAARISALYKTDDLLFKHDVKIVGTSLPALLGFVVSHTAGAASLADRVQTILSVVPQTPRVANEIIKTRCERGADIARRLRFSERVASGIHDLDEHWDGSGNPAGKKGEAIPVYARIALLAQVVDVFNTAYGRIETRKEVARRAGSWFDPALVAAFTRAQGKLGFWEGLASPHLESTILELEPGRQAKTLDDDFLDDIAEAFAEVVDSKSPYTSGHSSRVAAFADMIAAELGFPEERRRWLKRGALLHDIGKLGVSSAILDKPARLTTAERDAMRQHAALTETILSRIAAFAELARVAGAHHERLDGKGYPHGLAGDEIAMETRILTTADIFDALTAKRPYRDALPEDTALEIMAAEVGSAIDPRCFTALRIALAKRRT